MKALISPIRHDGTLHFTGESFGVAVIVCHVGDLLVADISGGETTKGERGVHGECG